MMRLPGTRPSMPLEDLQRALTQIIDTAPLLPDTGPIPPGYMKWAADAYALIIATGYLSLGPEAQIAVNGLSFGNRVTKREQLMMILHKARSQIELEMRQAVGSSGAKSINDLISPYYQDDPRKSDMDPRTSNLGFRPAADVQATPIAGVQATGGTTGQASTTRESKLEELAVKVALLEAAISLPKPVGVGHNRGPNLENEEEDENEIGRLIAILKEEREIAAPAFAELVERETRRAEQGMKLHVEFAKGVAKGAGYVVGKDIVEGLAGSAWWISVYERLMDVVHVLRGLIS